MVVDQHAAVETGSLEDKVNSLAKDMSQINKTVDMVMDESLTGTKWEGKTFQQHHPVRRHGISQRPEAS